MVVATRSTTQPSELVQRKKSKNVNDTQNEDAGSPHHSKADRHFLERQYLHIHPIHTAVRASPLSKEVCPGCCFCRRSIQ